jgi:hypothetical protein
MSRRAATARETSCWGSPCPPSAASPGGRGTCRSTRSRRSSRAPCTSTASPGWSCWWSATAAPTQRRGRSWRFYLDHRAGVDTWDLVDASARDLLGGELIDGDRAILAELAGSQRMWDRRIAVVATHALILRGELGETFALAERLMDDPHHLIHKALGWMLREAGKQDEAALVAFLEAHRAGMPRTTLRYAIERLTPEQRAALMLRD